MTMQNNIDISWWNVWWNMLEPKLQSFALQINNQWPVFVPIAISTDNSQWRTDRFEVQGDGWFADIAQMPDFVSIACKIENYLRQLVMGVRQDENLHLAESRTPDTTGTKLARLNFCSDLRGLCARPYLTNVI